MLSKTWIRSSDMTIDQAITWLSELKKKHGGEIHIYFDCPNCRQSHTPGIVETKAVVMITGEKQSGTKPRNS
jgi:hypothetical protein